MGALWAPETKQNTDDHGYRPTEFSVSSMCTHLLVISQHHVTKPDFIAQCKAGPHLDKQAILHLHSALLHDAREMKSSIKCLFVLTL